MTKEVLQQILAEGAQREGAAFLFERVDATLLVDLGGNLVMVEKLKRVELKGETMVSAETSRGERYLVAADDVCGLKLAGGTAGDAGTGFVA